MLDRQINDRSAYGKVGQTCHRYMMTMLEVYENNFSD